MNKSDLKNGNVVELRNGDFYVLVNIYNKFILIALTGKYHFNFDNYSIDLTHPCGFEKLDIMKVYKDYTCKELLWERKEEPKLTEDEKVILRNLPKEYKYIARQKYGELAVYQSKPYKDNICGYWEYYENSMRKFLSLYNHLFQFIKWEDEESYLIEDLLKGEEK